VVTVHRESSSEVEQMSEGYRAEARWYLVLK
jgi:hypothetical protein